MKHIGAAVFYAGAVFISFNAGAQTFENFSLQSPSIISPSQLYQVKQPRIEGLVRKVLGDFEAKDDRSLTSDLDTFEVNMGFAMPLAANFLVASADVLFYKTDIENAGGDISILEYSLRPRITANVADMLALGASVELITGEEEQGDETNDIGLALLQLGATLHLDQWEASLAFQNQNQETAEPQNNRAQELRLHGRYRLAPALAFGLSYKHLAYSKIALEGEEDNDESIFSVIAETAFSEQFTLEIALQSAQSIGAKDDRSTGFQAIAYYNINPTWKTGLEFAYVTGDTELLKYTLMPVSLMLSAEI